MRKPYEKIFKCHCCGADFKQFPEQRVLRLDHDECLCPKCFFTEELQASLEWMNCFTKVENAFQNPINRFRFIHKTFEEKVDICLQMIEAKIITFHIGTY